MKTLNGLKGVKELSKNEQKSIAGGKMQCKLNMENNPCPTGCICYGYACECPVEPPSKD